MGTIKHMSRKKVFKNCQLQEVWIWPQEVTDLLRPLILSPSINVCAGLSSLGDIKVDLEPARPDIIKADMNALPFDDNSFETVISDPPWKTTFFKRQRPFFECVRVCKVAGRIIYNCTWRPVSKYVQLEKAILRTDNNWANVSVIWIFKKIADIPKERGLE